MGLELRGLGPAFLLALSLIASVLVSAQAHKDCYASVGGAQGHVFQFDGGHVTTDPVANGCHQPLLLTGSDSALCQFDILARFTAVEGDGGKKLSQLSGVIVKMKGGDKFELHAGRHLAVNGHAKRIPHAAHGGARIFYSGEDLVFVHKRCHFWVTYDGRWTATYRLEGSHYAGRIDGLAGDCNGRRDEESASTALSKWLAKAGCSRSHSPHHRECHSEEVHSAGLQACQRVITEQSGVLGPCVADFCAAAVSGNAELKQQILCADFYQHSRRCAGHHRPLTAWRHQSGCPLSCPANQHFAAAANPCPDTCNSHFFGAPKHCFKLPSVEGCQCNRGLVLDGRRCVRPKHCECLAKLCVDRMPRGKCLRWRAHGRCDRYPEVMSRLCRLTCGLCRPRCRNQLSDKLCDKFRARGKCVKPFYRAVCQAACQPKLCHCPASRHVASKCSHRFKNKSVAALRWFSNIHGKCVKSVLQHFEPCGFCPRRVQTVMKPCNYCTGLRVGRRTVQFRERDGQRRCLQRVHHLSRRCSCPPHGFPKVVSHTRCRHHTTTVRTVKLFRAAEHCSKCIRVTRRSVVKRINCHGRRTVLTKCRPGRSYHLRREFYQRARHCACRWCLSRQRKLPCRCPRPVSRTVCSEGGRHLVTVTRSWQLDHKEGRCVRRVVRTKQPLECKPRRRIWVTCNRDSCTAVRHATWFHLARCKCVRRSARRHLGKCCCPHGYKKMVRINHYWKKLIRVQYILKGHKCHKRVRITKIRVTCPGPKSWRKCDGVKGARVFTKVWFEKKGNVCIRRRLRRVMNVECNHGHFRHASPCHIRRGVSRYRKIKFQFSRRREGTCRCVRVHRVVEEFCGCKKGKFLVVSKCPKAGCSGGKACGPDCYFTKTYFFFEKKRDHHSGKSVGCHKRVLKQLRFPCCCPSNRRVRRWCHADKFVVKQVSYTAMAKGRHECHRFRRTTSVRIRCRHGPHEAVTKKLPHPKPDHYYLATYRWRLKHCRCLVTVAKRPCLKRCRAPIRKRFCDRLQRQWVTRRVRWHLRGCRTCVQRVSERRVPVRCSRVVRHSRHCDRHSGLLTLTATSWRPSGCGCIRHKRVRHQRCRCPKPIVGRPHCSPERHAFVKRTVFWVLEAGQCLRRHRIKVTRVHCERRVRFKNVCRAKSGIKTVYIGVMQPRGCHCVRQWSVHNRLRCNCDRENRKVKGIVHRYCDRLRNLREAVTHRYVLRKGCCLRRTRSRIRGFDCPPPLTEKLPCDLRRRIQLTLTHFSIKRNCRCVRALRKRGRKCGCPHGPKVHRRRFCRKAPGVVVSVTTTQRWSHRLERCVHRRVTRSHRILCSQKSSYSVSKCIRNKFYVVTKVYNVRRGCRCFKRTVKRKKNCHCKTILRRYKCPKHGYTRRLVTQIMRWDSAKKRCRTVRYVTKRIRCRCPKPSERRFCHAGAWVKETTRFALRHHCCYKRVERRERRVHCPRIVRHRYTACHGCHERRIYTLEQRLHPKRCACYFAVVKRRSCPCCCRKPVSRKRCIHSGTAWQRVTVTYSPLEGKQCGCQHRVSRYTRHVACSKRRRFTWLACNRHTCLCRQRVEFSVVRHCGCHRVSRFTGRQRVCCCHQKPRLRRYCSNSAIYQRRVTWHLKRWRCVRRTRVRILKKWSCRKNPKVIVGRCNRATCHQHLHTLISRVDWPRCRCRRVVIHPRSRLCCCLQRPSRSHHCDNAASAWVTTRIRFKFSASRCVCLRVRRVTRVPIHCPAAYQRTHRCDRHTCRRAVDHVRFAVRDCRIVRRVTRTSHLCCCPPPRRHPPRCVRHRHEWLSRRVAWHLTDERCVKRVTTIRRRVSCAHHPRASIHVLTCNRHTCRQGVKKTVWRLVGCSCVARSHVSFRTCCCRPKIRTVTRCERHKNVVRYTTRRLLDHSRHVCVNKRTKTLLHRVGHCRGYERRGKCNRKTRHRTVRVVLRRVRHCRCGVYRRIVRRYLCSCPKPVIRRSKCNKASCHRSVVKVWFTSHGHWRHFKCHKHRRVIRIRCCCKRHPGHRVFCDRHSGDIKRKDWWTVFVAESKSCEVRHELKVLKPLTCPESSSRLSKCNRHTGYKVKVCTTFWPVRHKCSCRKRVSRRRIICYCPPSLSQNFCTKDKLRVFVRTSWRLSHHQNRCVKTIKRVVKHLECSKRRWRVKKCHHDCTGIWYYHRYRIRNCKCHRVTHTRQVKCCCPKPNREKRCLGNQWLTVVTKHRLRKGHCIKVVKSRRRTIWCRRIKVRIGHCDRDCNKRRVILRYGIRQCKCVLVKRIVRVRKCCCPKPRRYKRCDAATGCIKRVKIVWHLSQGKCLKHRRVTARRIVCHGSWSRVGKCNHVTRHQKVTLVRYHRVGCRCRRHTRVLRFLCRCRPQFVVKEKCTPHKWKRRVYKVTYRLSHPHSKLAKCLKHRRLWYEEPCKCPKPSHQRRCSRDGAFIVTSVRTWRLITVKRYHHRQRVCVRRTTVRHRLIHCPGPSVSWSACHGCQKKRTTVKFHVHHCKCRRRVTVRVFACNCGKKSYRKRHCDRHSGHIVYARRTCFARPGAAECSCRTKRWQVPTVCPSRRRKTLLSKRHCGLHRKHGWFSRFSIEWHTRRDCGCVQRRRTVLHFCRCQHGRKRVRCSLDGKTIIAIRDFYKPEEKHGGQVCGCRHIRQVTKRRVACSSVSRPRVRFGGCDAHCKRSVSVTQCYVRRCHRRHCSRSALQLCCRPKAKHRRFCEKKSGKWVRESVRFRLVPSVPLLKDCIHDHVLVHQLKVVSRTRRTYRAVHCPRGSLREHCDRHTGRWLKTRVTWHRVGCHCIRRVRRWRGKCKCPAKRIHWSPCRHRYKVKTVIWFVLRSHACKRHVHRRSYLCSCPKPRRYTRCDHRGAWETCHIAFRLRFRQQRCQKLRTCHRRMHTCPVAVERRSECADCRRTIRHVSWRLNRRKCACVRSVKTRVAECNCWKKHSRSTVCQHGAFVTRIVTHRQRGERCAKVVRTITRPVHCSRRRIKRLVPDTCVTKPGHGHCGYQKLMFEWRTRHGCKCVRKRRFHWVPCLCRLIKKYRERRFSRCLHGSVVLHVKIYFTLQGCKCVKRVIKHRRKIICTGVKNHRGPCKPNGHGDTYWTKKVWHRHSNGHCGCQWRLAAVHRRVCRCRPSRLIKLCVHDHIRRRIHVRYHPVPKTIHCRGRRHIRDERLGCPLAFTRKSKCHKCSFTIRKYAYGFKNCRCYAKLIATRQLKCCCPASVTERHCDTKRHLFVSVTVSYQLRHHRCYRRRETRTRRLRCDRVQSLYRVSKCVHEHREITKTVRLAVGCVCRVKTTHYRQRCACPHRLIYRRGKCGHWFAHDVWLGFRLKDTGLKIPGTNNPVLKCFKVVVDRRKRRCRCPKPYRRSLCRRDDRIVHISVSYNLHGNSCQRRRMVRESRLPCSRHRRLLRVIVSPCLAKDGYIQSKKRIYVHAKQCRCHKTTRVTHHVCNCLLKYGGKKRSVKCVGPNRLVKRVFWMVHKGHGCAKHVKTSTRVLHCPKERRVRAGHCKRSTGLRTFHIYHLIIRHCKCVWRLVRKATAPCLCQKPVQSKRCHDHTSWVTVKLWWSLEGAGLKAHCLKHRRRIVRPVKCPVGRRVRRSHGCDHLGYRTTVITIFRLKHCQCQKRVERSRCRCRCPKDRVHRFCRRQAWVTVRLEHKLEKCACHSTRRVSRQPVPCPERTHERGRCHRAGNGDKYRKLVWTSWRGSGCRCHRKRITRHQLCGCDRRRRKQTACVAGCRRVSVTSERRLTAGRCRRVRIRRRTVRVHCGRPSVRRVCHKATGELSVFVVKPFVKNCRCYKQVVKHTRQCGCHKGHKLVKVGKCNRHSCRQRLYFKRQILDQETEKCIWRRYHRHRVCCCHGSHREVRCIHKLGYHVIKKTKIVLRHWHCVRRVTRTIHPIKCSWDATRHSRRLKGGVLKLVDCWHIRVGCDCLKRCRTVFRRYRCKKPSKRVACRCSGGKCRVVTHLTHWRLAKGRCYRQTRTHAQPTICPANSYSRSLCDLPSKYGYHLQKHFTFWYQKACRCHRKSRVSRIVCRCWKPLVRRHCQRHDGQIVTVRVAYHLKRGHCAKSVQRRSRQVSCGRRDWQYSHSTPPDDGKFGVYYKVYWRLVRSGCRCVKQHKRTPCRSRCPACTEKTHCSSAGSELITAKTCWHLVGCHCIRRVTTTRRVLACPRTTRRVRCHRSSCALTTAVKSYRLHACRCHATKRTSRHLRCCCPKPVRTRACVKGSVVTRLVTHRLVSGRCLSNASERHRRVTCPHKRRLVVSGRCIHGKGRQRYSLHYWVRHGCKCVKRVQHRFKHCTCQYNVVDLIVAVDLYSKKGDHGDRRSYRSTVAKFLDTLLYHFKYGTSKVRTTVFVYNSAVKVHKFGHLHDHHSHVAKALVEFTNGQTDLHCALKAVYSRLRHTKPTSGVKKIVLVITRGNHHSGERSLALAEKIQRRAEMFVVGYGSLPKAGRYVKWLASRPRRQHYLRLRPHRKYHFLAARIFKRTCHARCVHRRKSHVGPCRRDTCRREIVEVEWKPDGHSGKCQKRRHTHTVACCCLGRNSNRLLCDHHHGRLIRVIVSHKFDFHEHVCHRRVRRIDVSASIYAGCRSSGVIRGLCKSDGWRRDTQVIRSVDHLTCRCRSKRHRLPRVRCRCPPTRRWRGCRQDSTGRWYRFACEVTHRLSHHAADGCAKSRRCRSHHVVCEGHRHRVHIHGRCHRRGSCRRRLGVVWYSVSNCRCRRHVKTWSEVCCCKQPNREYSFCDRHRHRHVRVHVSHRLVRGACRRVVRKVARPVPCPTVERVRLGHKCHPHGKGFYRRVVKLTWRLTDCRCERESHDAGWRLCRCRRLHRTATKCHIAHGVVATRRWWLAASGNECQLLSRIVSRVAVTCSAQRRKHVGPCEIAGKDDCKFLKVTVWWQRRVGCHCKTFHRSHTRLCACSERVRRVTRCHSNHWLTVSFYQHRLSHDTKGHATCRMVRTSRRRRVTCGRPKIHHEKCHHGKRTVQVTVFRPRHCHCVAKIHTRVAGCKPRCRDQLPAKICRRWAVAVKVQVCQKHPHIATRLCAMTCGFCCRSATSFVFSGKHCLTRQQPGTLELSRHAAQGLVIAKKTTFDACASACSKNPHCRAFDYVPKTRVCHLLRIGRHSLSTLSPTPGCLLFEKSCHKHQPHHACPFRRVVKTLPCRCYSLFGKKHEPLCYRKAVVAVHRRCPHGTGACRRNLVHVLIPCRWCEDSRQWCRDAARGGKCAKSASVRHACRHSCRMCKRHRDPHLLHQHTVGGCSHSGWRKTVRGGLWYDHHLQLWRVLKRISRQRCVQCPIGSSLIVGRCTSERKRKLTWFKVWRQAGHRCKVSRHEQSVACCGGGLDLVHSAGRCKRSPGSHSGWQRHVTTRFTVQEFAHGHKKLRCVVRKHTELRACSPKCPKRHVRRGRCIRGLRTVRTQYYVTYPGSEDSHRCVPKHYTQSEHCVSTTGKACEDKLSPADCAAVKHHGLCGSLHALCLNTCRKCK